MKLEIDNDELAEEFFFDATLYGIVAPIRQYQFCALLNANLGFNFKIKIDYEVKFVKKQRIYFFDVYEFNIDEINFVHYLYNNKNDGEYLLPEFKNVDFLWLAKGEPIDEKDANLLKNSIRTIKNVQLITEISTQKIKNKAHLIL
jgi:hypothetical protein